MFIAPSEGLLRILFALLFFVVTVFKQHAGLLLICFSASWWEIPTLEAGFTNQFIIESGIIGYVIAIAMTNRRHATEWSAASKHPMFHILAFTVAFSLVSIPITWGYWSARTPLGELSAAIQYILPRIMDWNSQDSYSHPWSMMFGFTVQIAFILAINRHIEIGSFKHKQNSKIAHNVFTAMVIGTCPVVFCALLQKFEIIGTKYAPDFGGTLQNGNHLSFVCGLMMIFALYLIYGLRNRRKFFSLMAVIFFVAFLLNFVGLFLGRGRSSWIAFLTSGFFVCILLLSVAYRNLNFQKFRKVSLVALVSILFFLGLAHWLVRSLGDAEKALIDQIYILVSEHRWLELLTVSGRLDSYKIALSAIYDRPLTGIGLGTFFSSAGLNIDLHNIYLLILVELGFVALVPLAFASFSLVRLLSRDLKGKLEQQILVVSVCVYCAVTGLGDVPFLYRSLMAYLVIFFAVLSSSHPRNPSAVRRMKWLLMIAVSFGMITIFSPQVRHRVVKSISTSDLHWFEVSGGMMGANCAVLPRLPSFASGARVVAIAWDEAGEDWGADLRMERATMNLAERFTALVPSGGPFSLCVCFSDKLKKQYISIEAVSRKLFVFIGMNEDQTWNGFQFVEPRVESCDDFVMANVGHQGE
jgi:O-antigen ligase